MSEGGVGNKESFVIVCTSRSDGGKTGHAAGGVEGLVQRVIWACAAGRAGGHTARASRLPGLEPCGR